MNHRTLKQPTIDALEELQIHYDIALIRHREWATGGFVDRLIAVFTKLPEGIKHKLFMLRDHKGILEVYWRNYPTLRDIKEVDQAWARHDESESEHHIVEITTLA